MHRVGGRFASDLRGVQLANSDTHSLCGPTIATTSTTFDGSHSERRHSAAGALVDLRHGLPEAILRKIYHDNAARLLGLEDQEYES